MRRFLIVLATAGVTALAPAVAGAQSATQEGYSPTPIPLISVGSASGDSSTIEKSKLPFTGLDAGVMALLAIGLVGLGFGIRRATRSRAG